MKKNPEGKHPNVLKGWKQRERALYIIIQKHIKHD